MGLLSTTKKLGNLLNQKIFQCKVENFKNSKKIWQGLPRAEPRMGERGSQNFSDFLKF